VSYLSLVVAKFGGSSVASIERIKNIALRVQKMKAEGHEVVVVVSAMGDTTDELIQLASSTGENLNSREMDMLLATGEQQSAALLSLTLNSQGCPAISLTGWQAGIRSDSTYNKAKINGIDNYRILNELEAGNIVVIAGFQGISPNGDITTLGRGGSDTTAVALAASLNADRCMIFTDVDGVYTADPRIVPEAKKLAVISYDEMLEMAVLGAVVANGDIRELHRGGFLARNGVVFIAACELESLEGVHWIIYLPHLEKLKEYQKFIRQ
jgi:aspartate kinase